MNKRTSAKQPSTKLVTPLADVPASQPATLPRSAAILFVVAACLVCLGYSLYTNQTWEDTLITLRQGENLLKGDGLTYNPGELVHGFTSPINVLLLTLCHLLTGQSSYTATLWLYRVFSIAAFAAGGLLMLKALYETPPRWNVATWFLGAIYLFDVKNVAFSINGMETAFMLMFVAWAVLLMSRARPEQWPWRGLCWAGLMWSRPDGCVYIVALVLAEFVFLATSRRDTIVSLAKSAAVCAVAYGPWILWAWWYYGSPVPHTIIAKGNVEEGVLGQVLATLDNLLAGTISMAAQVFRPIYCGDTPQYWLPGMWGRVLTASTEIVGIVALLYVFCPVKDRFGRAMSLCFLIVCIYFAYMPVQYPWYFPPAMIFGGIAFARAATALASANQGVSSYLHLRQPRTLVRVILVVLAVGALAIFAMASFEERVQQAEIEQGNRAVLGAWLKENGKPTDRVYLEPLGYIGYYSGMRMQDFPGLVSPEMVQIRRRLSSSGVSYVSTRYLVIPEIKADWVVLRPIEYQNLTRLGLLQDFQKDYALVKEFSVEDRLRQYSFLPGRKSLEFDANYGVFRRKPSAPTVSTK